MSEEGRSGFESFVNSIGSKAGLAEVVALVLFESFVNSIGSKAI